MPSLGLCLSESMLRKQLFIRADASPAIGMGHRVRCQVLADAFLIAGWQVNFVTLDRLQYYFEESDIKIKAESEFRKRAAAADLVILDHYGYDGSMIETLYQIQPNLLLLDDMNDRGPLACQWLLNPVSLDYKASCLFLSNEYQHTMHLFVGAQYALLRSQFSKCTATHASSRDKLLISLGGTDPLGLTLPILKNLVDSGFLCQDLIVMLGKSAMQADEVKHFCTVNHIECHQGVSEVAELMRQSKFAISAAGSTLFELAAMKVPSIFLQVADNQSQLLKVHADLGWCRGYRLDNQTLEARERLLGEACQQLMLDWQDMDYQATANQFLASLTIGSAATSIVSQVEKVLFSKN